MIIRRGAVDVPADLPTLLSGLVAFREVEPGVFVPVALRATESGSIAVDANGEPTNGEFRSAYCLDGAAAVVPGASVSGIAANDIIHHTFPGGLKRLALIATTDQSAGNNHLGWWVTWNAGNPVTAKNRLAEWVAGGSYAAGATVNGDTNAVSMLIPVGAGQIYIPAASDITDTYMMPVASAGVVAGGSILQGVLG